MSINQLEDFSAKPYFDDFKEEKGFHKILFKPNYPVQARELNQLQTILQNQVSKLGHHMFKNGSMVIPGTPKYNAFLAYVIVDKNVSDLTMGERLIGKTLTEVIDVDVTLQARVQGFVDAGANGFVILKYSNSAVITVAGALTNKKEFSPSSELIVEESSELITTSSVSHDPDKYPLTGIARMLSVGAGVFFVDGYFVHTPEQSIVVGLHSNDLNIKSGFKVNKIITTAYDDESLFDNAAGGPNEAAPGADRFTIELELANLLLSDEETNFVELIRLERGNLRTANIDPQYNVLADTLARRTHDESGDYAVNGFNLKAMEHLKDENHPNGFVTADDGGDSNKFVIEISPGKAYVKGYEVVNQSNYYLATDKARTPSDTKVANDLIQVNEYGEYIYIAPGNQFIDIAKHPIIWLTSGQESVSPVIGHCIPKYIESFNVTGTTVFKLYGTFSLNSNTTFNWGHVGGWRLNQLKNGPVLQLIELTSVISDFNVVNGLPLTSHPGYTPYAWDKNNSRLYCKKTQSAPVFNVDRQVVKAPASGYATNVIQKESRKNGGGELFELSLGNIKTIKDESGNVELQTDVSLSGVITTNASGYGEINLLGDGIFVGDVFAANMIVDNAYFDNIVSIENSGKRLVINNSSYANVSFSISASLRKNLAVRSKTLTEGTTLITKPSNKKMILKHKDIYKIKAIYVSADLMTAPTETDEEISKFFNLSNTDTLDLYGNSSIKSKSGFGTPGGQMLVVYDYFLHGGGDVFCVDSYVSLRDNVVDNSDVTHIGRIPVFKTRDETYILSDYLDFRKSSRDGFFLIKGNITNGSATVSVADDYTSAIVPTSKVYAPGFEANPTTVLEVTSTTLVLDNPSEVTGSVYFVINAPDATSAAEPFTAPLATWSAMSDSTVTYDASYFVDRWDRLAIDTKGKMQYVFGVAGSGRYPEEPENCMSLGLFKVPGYTRNSSEIIYKKSENRRYTMRDIGKLEKRIENLEYYTTLTLRELETKEMKILDANGLDRFKSGLFVSNFKDFGVFNPFNETFNTTLFPEQSRMIPREFSDSIAMNFNAIDSENCVIKGNKIFHLYAHRAYIEQPYATAFMSVNPYLIVAWDPQVMLIPDTDNWVETEWAPAINNITTIVVDTQTSSTENIVAATPVIRNRSVTIDLGVGAAAGTRTETTSTSRQEVASQTQTSSVSSSARNEIVSDTTRVIRSAIIPLMRSREVEFTMTGAKPTTRYWARFDNTAVSHMCAPYNPTTQVRGSWGEPLVTDAMGKVVGIFRIPSNTFMNGERIFELSDIDKADADFMFEECLGTAVYKSNGVTQTMQQTVNQVNTITNNTHTITTNNVSVVVDNVSTNFITSSPPPTPDTWIPAPDNPAPVEVLSGWALRAQQRPLDPIAQTFFTEELSGEGMFLTKIDIFFAKRDSTAPVWLEVKEVVNGQPVSTRIDGSLVILAPQSVTISDDSTIPTTFEFDIPIYLQANQEYAFVVGSSSSRYAIWTAKMGEKVINEEMVLGSQPCLGTLMKSQNNSTWTPFQLEDVKFRLYRAQFNDELVSNAVFTNAGTASRRIVKVAQFSTTSGSNIVRIKHENHGMSVNEFVVIEAEEIIGASSNSPAPTESFNGVPFSSIYGTKLVKEVYSINEYGIEIPGGASVTGDFENVGSYVFIKSNINYYKYSTSVSEFVPGGTKTEISVDLITGKDFDGNQSTQVIMPEQIVQNAQTNYLRDVGLIQIAENESAQKSVKINVRSMTSDDAVCPVIDLRNTEFVVHSLNLNKPEVSTEHLALSIDGNASSKSETQVIKLETMSTSIRVFTAENKSEQDGLEIWFRSTDTNDIESRNWTLLVPEKNAIQIDTTTFVEIARHLDEIVPFNEYQLKLVFKGTNSARYPSITELRVITVAS